MRLLVIAAMWLCFGLTSPAGFTAEAQGLPKYLKSCKKDPSVTIHDYTYKVASPNGPPGLVTVTHEHYECKDPETRNTESVYLHGMTDSSGKVVVPVKYAQVLPFSTKGALVLGHGNERYPKTLNYRTYIAGKGEGKDRYTFDNALRLHPDGTCSEPDVSDGSLISVTGLDWHTDGSGRMDVTLFTADGKTRRLENMGGEGAGDAALRVGDVFLASWKDEGGAVRSGILDLEGRPIAPVLGKPAIWSTLVSPGPDGSIPHGCEEELSQDLFIEGPSLDLDPAKPFFGPLLIPVRRDGQPAVLPEGAIGMFPAYVRDRNTARKDRKQNAVTWGVVFPAANGFQFTLHVGPPSEALIAAETAPRYSDIGRSIDHGGMVGAKSVADGLWRWFSCGYGHSGRRGER